MDDTNCLEINLFVVSPKVKSTQDQKKNCVYSLGVRDPNNESHFDFPGHESYNRINDHTVPSISRTPENWTSIFYEIDTSTRRPISVEPFALNLSGLF